MPFNESKTHDDKQTYIAKQEKQKKNFFYETLFKKLVDIPKFSHDFFEKSKKEEKEEKKNRRRKKSKSYKI